MNNVNDGDRDLRTELETLRSDLNAVRNDLRSIAGAAIDEGRTKAGQVRHDVENRITDSLGAIEQCVQERPITTLAMAFGAGMILSRLMSRR